MTLQCRGRDYNSTLLHEYSHPDLFYHDQYSRLTPPGKPLNKFGCIRSVGCSRVTRSERYTCGQCKSLLRNNRFVWILKRKLKKKNQKTTRDRYASHSLLQKRLIQTRYVSFFSVICTIHTGMGTSWKIFNFKLAMARDPSTGTLK